jgi:hypothetical protein
MSQTDEYRQKAAECQQQAEKSVTVHDKQQRLSLAKHWLKLSNVIDQLEGGD